MFNAKLNRTARVAAALLVPAIALTLTTSADAAAPKKLRVSSGDLHLTIPDTGVATKTIVVKKAGKITDVNVVLAAQHNQVSDLTFLLRSPQGKVIHLSSGNGGTGNGYGTSSTTSGCDQTMSFNDEAEKDIADYEGVDALFDGAYKPESWQDFSSPKSSLVALNGKNMKGAWQLIAVDSSEIGGGTLECFKLNIKYTPIG